MKKHKLADAILSNYEYRIVHQQEDAEEALFSAVTNSMGSFPFAARADLHAVLADLWPNYAAGLERKIAVRIAVRDWRGRYQSFRLDYQTAESFDNRDKPTVSPEPATEPQDGIAALIGGAA